MTGFAVISCAFIGLLAVVPGWHGEGSSGHASPVPEAGPVDAPLRGMTAHPHDSSTVGGKMGERYGQAPSRSLSAVGSEVTCPAPQGNTQEASNTQKAVVQIDEYKLQASFTCGESYNTSLLPASNETSKCLEQPDAGSGKAIRDVLQVEGSFEEVDRNKKKYTLTLAKMPSREKVVYYKCNGANSNVCTVEVKMPSQPAPNVCTLDGTVELTVGEAKEVEFFCKGDNAELDPVPAEQNSTAYRGGACEGTPEKLGDLLPGSSLSTAADGAYTLSVASLPKEATTLCFKCIHKSVPEPKNATASDRTCKVVISVAASPSTTTTQSTGSAYTTSASFVFAAAFTVVSHALTVY